MQDAQAPTVSSPCGAGGPLQDPQPSPRLRGFLPAERAWHFGAFGLHSICLQDQFQMAERAEPAL